MLIVALFFSSQKLKTLEISSVRKMGKYTIVDSYNEF